MLNRLRRLAEGTLDDMDRAEALRVPSHTAQGWQSFVLGLTAETPLETALEAGLRALARARNFPTNKALEKSLRAYAKGDIPFKVFVGKVRELVNAGMTQEGQAAYASMDAFDAQVGQAGRALHKALDRLSLLQEGEDEEVMDVPKHADTQPSDDILQAIETLRARLAARGLKEGKPYVWKAVPRTQRASYLDRDE